jgi:hypothetical protein
VPCQFNVSISHRHRCLSLFSFHFLKVYISLDVYHYLPVIYNRNWWIFQLQRNEN